MFLPVNIRDSPPVPVPGERIWPFFNNGNTAVAYAEIDESIAHYHKHTKEWYVCVKGEGDVFLDGKPVRLRKDEYLFIPLGTVHKARKAGEEFAVYVITEPSWTKEDHHIVG